MTTDNKILNRMNRIITKVQKADLNYNYTMRFTGYDSIQTR